MTEEVRSPIGFLMLPDGPIELDYQDLQLSQQAQGVDFLMYQPILIRQSETIYFTKDEAANQRILKNQLAMVTVLVVHDLQYQRIPGEVMLYYETVTLHWDLRIVCKVYRV